MLNHDMKEGRAKKLASCVGGRLVHLESQEMRKALFSLVLSSQRAVIAREKPESKFIIKKLSESGSISPSCLINVAKNKKRMEEAIKAMVHINIVRYDESGAIKWHGKVQEELKRQDENKNKTD